MLANTRFDHSSLLLSCNRNREHQTASSPAAFEDDTFLNLDLLKAKLGKKKPSIIQCKTYLNRNLIVIHSTIFNMSAYLVDLKPT